MNEEIIIKRGDKVFKFSEGLNYKTKVLNVQLQDEVREVWDITPDTIFFSTPLKGIRGISRTGLDRDADKKIVEWFKKLKQIEKQKEEEERREKYAPLYEQMKEIPMPKQNTYSDDKKCQDILKQRQQGFSDFEENEGLNLAVAHKNAEIEAEAQKYCNHDFKVKYEEGYTEDSRLKLIREVSCDKCGFKQVDEVEEPVKNWWV